jgi:hypothetical protein
MPRRIGAGAPRVSPRMPSHRRMTAPAASGLVRGCWAASSVPLGRAPRVPQAAGTMGHEGG